MAGLALRILQSRSRRAAHVHIRKDRKETKIWLNSLNVARNKRCTKKELSDLLRIVGENQQGFLEKWHEHFGN